MMPGKTDPKGLMPFMTTGIGTLPHKSAHDAVELVLRSFDIPFWPQLPAISFKEQMVPQCSEGIPFVRIDEKSQKIWVKREETDELERFYESYTEKSLIAISEEYAKGLYEFLKAVPAKRLPLLKGHVTGPLTFTLGLCDEEGKNIYYDEEMREICLMALKAKTRWQAEILGSHAEGLIIFVDEPILSALGSTAYMGVKRSEVLRLLTEAVNAIKETGSMAGIHCCGRAEWPLIIESGVDILSFDAYGFGDTLGIYPEELRRFLEKGGILAWGAVPTTEEIAGETEEGIKKMFHTRLEALSKHIPQRLLTENIILTPSCGTGSRSIGETTKVFQLLMRLKEELSS